MAGQSWARFLLIAGLIGILAAAIDPLEGSLSIVPAAGVAALGVSPAAGTGSGFTSGSSCWRRVENLFVLSALGGIGGSTGQLMWWAAAAAVRSRVDHGYRGDDRRRQLPEGH